VHNAIDQTSLSPLELQRLAGYLNFVAMVVPLGHTFLRRLYNMQLYFPTITLVERACIIIREVYATIRESIYPNPSFLSRDFPEASGRLLRNHKEFTLQDMAN